MEIKRKTYAVNGIMEWVALINAGKAQMKVHFSGGSLTGYGVTPATFTTEDPMKQAIIENSHYFKSGKIYLSRDYKGTGKYKDRIIEHHADTGTHIPGAVATACAVMDSALNPNGKPVEADVTAATDEAMVAEESENTAEEGENDSTASEPAEETAENNDGKKIVEVSDIDEARHYLNTTFEVAMSRMRYNSNVHQIAAENGIVFKFPE